MRVRADSSGIDRDSGRVVADDLKVICNTFKVRADIKSVGRDSGRVGVND